MRVISLEYYKTDLWRGQNPNNRQYSKFVYILLDPANLAQIYVLLVFVK